MTIVKHVRLLGAAAIVTGASTLAATAQTQPTAPATPPAAPAAKPDATPMPPPAPAAKPSDMTKSPAPASRSADKSAAAAPSKEALVGASVFSSDGSKLGSVQKVTTAPDGKVKGIQIKTGGFLGFGGKMVEIPEAKFTKSGDNIQLGMTADEVSKLPEVKDQS